MTNSDDDNYNTIKSAKANAWKVFAISVLIILPICIYLIFFTNGHFFNLGGHGMIALTIGIVFSALSAFFFMGMSFFSSRSGIDDQPNYREIVEKQRRKDER